MTNETEMSLNADGNTAETDCSMHVMQRVNDAGVFLSTAISPSHYRSVSSGADSDTATVD